jgi:hypothetical protein
MRDAKIRMKKAQPMSPMGSKQDAPMSPRCHLPSGVSQSPKGDIGDHRQRELRAAFPRRISGGKDAPKAFAYSKPQVANDYGDKGAALA